MSTPYKRWGVPGGVPGAFQPQTNQELPFDPAIPYASPEEGQARQNVMQSQQRFQDALGQQSQANQSSNFMDSPIFQLGVPTLLTALTAIAPRHMATAGPLGMAGFRTATDVNMANENQRRTVASSMASQSQTDFNKQKLKYAIDQVDIDPSVKSAILQQADVDLPGAAKAFETAAKQYQQSVEFNKRSKIDPKSLPENSTLDLSNPVTGEKLTLTNKPEKLTLDQALRSDDPHIRAGAIQALKDQAQYAYHPMTFQPDESTGTMYGFSNQGGVPVGRPVQMAGGGGGQAAPASQPTQQQPPPSGPSGPLSGMLDSIIGQQKQAPTGPAPAPHEGARFAKGNSAGISEEEAVAIAQRIHDYKDDPEQAKLGRRASAQVTGKYALMFPDDNLADRKLEYGATKAAYNSLNSSTQQVLRQNVERASHQMDLMEDAIREWKQKAPEFGMNVLDTKTLNIAAKAGGELGALAQNVLGQSTNLAMELAKVNMGGASPTDKAIAEAQNVFSGGWTEDTYNKVFPSLRQNIANAKLALGSVKVEGVGGQSHYGKMGAQPQQESTSSSPDTQKQIQEILNMNISREAKKALLIKKGLAQ